MIKYLLLISSLLVSGVTCAKDEWIKAAGADSMLFYINPERMVSSDDSEQSVNFWVKTIITKTTNGGKSGYLKGDYQLSNKQFNCSNRTDRFIKTIHYSKNKVVYTSTDFSTEFEEVVPESVNEALLNKVCEYKFPKSSN